MPLGNCSSSHTSRSDSGYGRRRSNTASTTVKMAIVAPRPRASVAIATALNPIFLRSWRTANLKSFHIARIFGLGTHVRRQADFPGHSCDFPGKFNGSGIAVSRMWEDKSPDLELLPSVNPRLGEIEVVLDAAEDFVVDHALVPQIENHV